MCWHLYGWGHRIDRVYPLLPSLAIKNLKNEFVSFEVVNGTQLPYLIAIFAEQREQVHSEWLEE